MSQIAGEPGLRTARVSQRFSRSVVAVSIAIALLVVIPIAAEPQPPSTPAAAPGTYLLLSQKIQHIVLLVEENHAYDNYFGTYCPTVGPHCSVAANAIPSGTCVPFNQLNYSQGCVRPYNFTTQQMVLKATLPHNGNSSIYSWDNGSMDGFYGGEKSGTIPFGHYNGSTAPLYWDLAEQYSLSDAFFSAVLSYSLPNHWHIVAGQSPSEVLNRLPGVSRFPVPPPSFRIANDSVYLGQANHTPSIEDLLVHNTSVSWKYYHLPLTNYTNAIKDNVSNPVGKGGAYAFFDPQAAKYESYNSTFSPHFVQNTAFFTDARTGKLPALSWVMPIGQASDHPPANVTSAEGFVASVVNAVESSPDWNTTALFVTWDDYGGFYDHVAPPLFHGMTSVGFRVPLILISPYARTNYVDHTPTYFESVLRLMETTFHLGCLAPTDCGAPLPLTMFNFTQPPRPPMLFSTSASNWSYPMVIQTAKGPATGLPPYFPPNQYATIAANVPPDQD
jgi:phospholipase C